MSQMQTHKKDIETQAWWANGNAKMEKNEYFNIY